MRREILIREFTEKDLESVYGLIQNAVAISYRDIYPEEALDLYKEYHNRDNILNDATAGYCVVAENGSEIVGTGTLLEGNVRRVYINPSYQHTGIGKQLYNEMEKKAKVYNNAVLELGASLIARRFWESLGFTVISEEFVPIKNDKKLQFYRMTKSLPVNDAEG